MKIFSADIAELVSGTITGPRDLVVNDIITDSRQIILSEGLVFFAISGKNHDGHQYIGNLYDKGIRIFVVERFSDKQLLYKDAAFVLVRDAIEALQLLAAYKRKVFKSTVIAVTGSTGKTIVKEWLADILGLTAAVIRSPKSYNSQTGVPLSVWKLEEKYAFGIFEAGISLPGEMERLQRVIDPDIGIITNIGDAHRENFPDDKTKAEEKLKLFLNSSVIVFCSDQKLISGLIKSSEKLKSKKLIDWSTEDRAAAVFVRKTTGNGDFSTLRMTYKGNENCFEIPFTDRASVENAITVASACLAMGIETSVIAKGLRQLVSVAMRMEMKKGLNNSQLIEDYYNSDPGSLGMALEYLKSKKSSKTTLVLSDFVQTGRDEKELYREIAGIVKTTGIDRFIGIGPVLKRNSEFFESGSGFFDSTDDFVNNFSSIDFRNETILLKGARIFEFERIGRLLEEKIHQTVLEINLDAISHNINEFRRYLDPGTRIMAMVKAFAYGAGPVEIAALLEYHRVSYLAVAYADEGVELRVSGVTLPVMVMNPDPYATELLIRYNLEPEIYSHESYDQFVGVASKHGLINYPVHIKIDTGMHRLGFMPEDLDLLAEKIKTAEAIKIVSVFSHLAASEDPSFDDFTRKQVSIFLEAADKLRRAAGYDFLRHILNSSGIVRMPQYQFEMVRPGIGIYGVGKFEGLTMKPAGRFKTRISQIKRIPAGEPVGYGFADAAETDRLIAILPVGYADGLNRMLGNRKGSLFIRGRKVPLVGNICMDMCMADVTGLNATTGDEAEVFGENITIDEIAAICGTIPYEILTSIPVRVKRVFYRD
jgi:Alr-MurF fusion protein